VRQNAISARGFLAGVAATGLVGLLIASGWAIAEGYATAIFIAVGIAGLCVLAFIQRGAFIGVLLLASMNGLPFIDTSRVIGAKVTLADTAVLALLITAGSWIVFDNLSYSPSRAGSALSRAAVLLLFWWLLTVARSSVYQHVSILQAAIFGRDFAFFALLVMLLPRVRLAGRDIGVLLGVLAVGVCLFALGQIATATGVGQPQGLIHYEKVLQQSGLTRLYTPMTDLVGVGLALSATAALVARQRVVRLLATPITLLLVVSVVVQLTRARWIGLVAGFLIVSIWLMINDKERIASILRRRLALVVCMFGGLGLIVVLAAPGSVSGGTVIDRFASLITDLQTGGGTVAVRESVTRMMTALLGGKWPFGLGFVPPSTHYFPGLPDGSIRDSDLGVLNAVMTMGVLGAALVYLPVLLALVNCLRRSSMQWTARYSWLRYGGAVWIVATLVSSVTLVTLFSTSGLALTAVVLTILVHPSVSVASMPVTVPQLGLKPAASGFLRRQHGLPITSGS
jgi:hypothetical protein